MVRITRKFRSHANDEQGVIAVVVAVAAVLVFVLAALIVDLGMARDTRREAQNASDAAALAAGNVLYNNSTTPKFPAAVQAAKDYAAQNYGVTASEWATCVDAAALRYQPTTTSCISFESSGGSGQDLVKPDTVRVLIPTRDVDTTLGALAGVSHVSIAAQAEVGVRLESVPACALCVLGPGPHNLQNGDATVAGGNIHFNGSVSVSNNGLIATDGDITVQNTASGPLANYVPDPQTNQAAIADPLAFMTMPDISALSAKTDPCTQGPGIYGDVDLNSRTCNLSPGLYVIAGANSEWDMSGNGSTSLNGTGVTLYFTCGSPSVPAACPSPGDGATLDASGNASLNIQAPTTGPLQGLAIIYDRNNAETLRLTGNGAAGFTGTVYAPAVKLQMNGNGCASTFNALIVVTTVEMNGNPSCLQSAYARSQNVDLPPDQLHLTK